MHSSKICFKCGVDKNLSEFYKHPQMADGHLGKCKECTKKDVSAHRLANIDRVRLYDRERAKRPERKAAADRHVRKWRSEDSRRSAAHSAVAYAIRTGRLVSSPCVRCGRDDAYAHHENYDKKLDVVWLCQPCHKERHKEMAAQGIEP